MKLVICVIYIVSLLLGYVNALLLDATANYCRVCNDNEPDNQCSTPHYTVCKQPNPFCMDVHHKISGQIKVVKRCASKSDCHNYWWLRTSVDPACSQSQLSSGNLATGITCSICCSSPHCNDGNYPVDVLKFPDTPVTSKPTIHITHTPKPTTPASTRPATTRTTTEATTIKTTHTTIALPTVTETASTTSTVRPPHHLHTTQFNVPHATGRTEGFHTPFPKAVMCVICDEDPTEGIKCDKDNTTICRGDTPYCMTSYKVKGDSYRIERRCASMDTCRDLWWVKTSYVSECFNNDLLLLKPDSTGSRPPSCNYCCHAVGAWAKGSRCNDEMDTVIPRQLLILGPLNVHGTTTPSPTSSSITTATGKKQRCMICGPAEKNCDPTHVSDCPDERPYCMNTLQITMRGHRVVSKGCASDLECYSEWWEVTRNKADCAGDLTSVHVSKHGLICSWCCNASSTDKPCNRDERPATLLDYTPPTTTTSTPTTTETTSSTTTTTSTTPTTTAKINNRCISCASSDKTCDLRNVQDCPDETPFCMNTLEISGSGHRVVKKKCASDLECYSEWWEVTRNKADCAGDLTSVHVSKHGLICSWCCNATSTDKPCNRDERPDKLLDYTPPTTSTTTTTTSPTTTFFTSTTATTKTSLTTLTFSTFTAKMNNVCISCASDEKTCGVTKVKECPDEAPYCMNTLEISGSGHRIVRKKCASDLECYSEWWEVTRNKADCAGDLTSVHVSKHGLICSWCCSNSSPLKPCNHGNRPATLLNYTAETSSTSKLSTAQPTSAIFNTSTLKTEIVNATTQSGLNTTASTTSKPTHTATTGIDTSTSESVTVNATSSSNLSNTTSESVTVNATSSSNLSNTTDHHPTSMVTTTKASKSTPNNTTKIGTITNPPVTAHVTYVNTTSTPMSANASVSRRTTSSVNSSATSPAVLTSSGTTHTVSSTSRDISTTKTPALATTNATSTHTIQCWDCDNGCPFIQSPIPCPNFCLTTVTDDSMYTRTIRKRCVNFDQCKELWWLQTSDVSVCTGMLQDSTYPTGVDVECNFCCTTDDCNKGDFPSKQSLFNGYKTYPHHG